MEFDFFYRIEGFDLVPGNKTAGFVLRIATEALLLLRMEIPMAERRAVLAAQQARLGRSGLVRGDALESCGMAFYGLSGCPLLFTTDPDSGGSLGARSEDLSRLSQGCGAEYSGPSIEYTPRNVDTPAQALILMILVQTWAEWARGFLSRLDESEKAHIQLQPLPERASHMTLEEYHHLVDVGALTSDDGFGVYATDTGMSNIHLYGNAQPAWATHVVWFGQ